MSLFVLVLVLWTVASASMCVFSEKTHTSSRKINLCLKNEPHTVFGSEDEKLFQKLGLNIFNKSSRSSPQKRRQLQNILKGIERPYFDCVISVLSFETLPKASNGLDRFHEWCKHAMGSVSVSEENEILIMEKFQKDFSQYIKQLLNSVDDELCDIFSHFYAKHYRFNMSKDNLCLGDREVEFDYVLESFPGFLKSYSISEKEKLGLKIWSVFPPDEIDDYIREVSVIRANNLVDAFLKYALMHIDDFTSKFKTNSSRSKKGTLVLSQQKRATKLELQTLGTFLKCSIAETDQIILSDKISSLIEEYILIRKSSDDISDYWDLWQTIALDECTDKHFLRSFIKSANKLKLSKKAWVLIAKIVYCFEERCGQPLKDIFKPSFTISFGRKCIDIVELLTSLNASGALLKKRPKIAATRPAHQKQKVRSDDSKKFKIFSLITNHESNRVMPKKGILKSSAKSMFAENSALSKIDHEAASTVGKSSESLGQPKGSESQNVPENSSHQKSKVVVFNEKVEKYEFSKKSQLVIN